MPRPPLRRSRLKARIAAAHGTVRVLEQALRAASSALALGESDMASCTKLVGTRPGIFRVNLDFCRYTRVLPGFGLVPSKFMAPDHTASKSEPGSVRGLS